MTRVFGPPAPPELAAPFVDARGWLQGAAVIRVPAHASWFYKALKTADGKPKAIVAHYTATKPGTAINMAKRRAVKRDTEPTEVDGDPEDRAASWHFSVETDGTIVQMVSCLAGAWHAGGGTAKPIPRIGAANRVSIGVELVGYGKAFPAAQVRAAGWLWRALVRAYELPRGLAMVTHQELDPTRKTDPGPVWMGKHAERVLDYAFGVSEKL